MRTVERTINDNRITYLVYEDGQYKGLANIFFGPPYHFVIAGGRDIISYDEDDLVIKKALKDFIGMEPF